MGNGVITEALGGYSWIDSVLIDGMDYFASVFWFFMEIAKWTGSLVLFVGLMISAIKLVFGAEAIKKVAIGTLMKMLLFLLLIQFYNPLVKLVSNTALTWGSRSGGGRATATLNLGTLMAQAKDDLALAQSIKTKYKTDEERKVALKEMGKKYKDLKGMGKNTGNALTRDLTIEGGTGLFRNQAHAYQDIDKTIDYQIKTLETLEGLLVNTQVKDKNGNLIDTYFLNTTLKDKHGNDTYYISPASFLKVSILTGNLMMKRQLDYMTIDYNEKLEENEDIKGHLFGTTAGVEKAMADLATWFSVYFNFSNLINILLCFICQVAIGLCAIFALIQYIMTIFEFTIVTSIVVFYVPFCLADITKQITAKLFPIFWNFFIKIMIITICMWFSLHLYINLAADQMGLAVPFDFPVFCTTMFTILLSFVVTQNAPKISQTIISGNPELSMGEFLQAGATMVGTGVLGAKIAKGGANTVARPAGSAVGRSVASHARAKAEGKDFIGQFCAAGEGIAKGVVGGAFKSAGNILDGNFFEKQTPSVTFKRAMAEGANKEISSGVRKTQKNDNKTESMHASTTENFNSNSTVGKNTSVPSSDTKLSTEKFNPSSSTSSENVNSPRRYKMQQTSEEREYKNKNEKGNNVQFKNDKEKNK